MADEGRRIGSGEGIPRGGGDVGDGLEDSEAEVGGHEDSF
jgi:hypothetical protein